MDDSFTDRAAKIQEEVESYALRNSIDGRRRVIADALRAVAASRSIVLSDDQMKRALDALDDTKDLLESLKLGCDIAYMREPTQAEGDAHAYRHDQSMGPSYGIPECHVPMGDHHGFRCKCGTWVWGGSIVCQRCVDRQAVTIAQEWQAEVARLRKLFADAGGGEHNVLALVDHYQRHSMEADERLRAVRKLLEENGCDCPCEHHWEDHSDDCERCLPCRIGEAVRR